MNQPFVATDRERRAIAEGVAHSAIKQVRAQLQADWDIGDTLDEVARAITLEADRAWDRRPSEATRHAECAGSMLTRKADITFPS